MLCSTGKTGGRFNVCVVGGAIGWGRDCGSAPRDGANRLCDPPPPELGVKIVAEMCNEFWLSWLRRQSAIWLSHSSSSSTVPCRATDQRILLERAALE